MAATVAQGASATSRQGLRRSPWSLRRQLALCLAGLLALPLASVAAALEQQVPASTQGSSSPAGINPQSANPGQGSPETVPAQPQQSGAQEPVGSAAAPYGKSIGAPASRPAGAVIAPARQKRARSVLIKVGLIVAAGVAIGTVVALSKSSSSRPH